jgi:acetyl-CoA carboxylase biotin carboxyl carrier protein
MAKMMNDAGLTEVTAEYSAFFGLLKHRIHLSKQKFCPAGAAMPTGNLPDSAHEGRENAGFPGDDAGGADDVKGAVTSPMVGVIYLSPEPNSKPFVTVGKTVSEGETLCLVEAMKTFNPIKAPKAGTVADILVQDGDTVEFGTPLIIIK